jgi:hypothetical protein
LKPRMPKMIDAEVEDDDEMGRKAMLKLRTM